MAEINKALYTSDDKEQLMILSGDYGSTHMNCDIGYGYGSRDFKNGRKYFNRYFLLEMDSTGFQVTAYSIPTSGINLGGRTDNQAKFAMEEQEKFQKYKDSEEWKWLCRQIAILADTQFGLKITGESIDSKIEGSIGNL